MSNSCKLIYEYIINNIKSYDGLYISNKTLSEVFNLSERTISININYLLDKNLIDYYSIGISSKIYCLPDSEFKEDFVTRVIL